MSTATQTQYAYRAQKSSAIIQCAPSTDYSELSSYAKPEDTVRVYRYSADGSLFAQAVASKVCILAAETGELVREIDVPGVVELGFSPLGTLLSTWERPRMLEDGAQFKNLRVWNVKTGEEVISYTQKSLDNWNFQYTSTESHAVRLVSGEVQIWSCSDFAAGVVGRLKLDGINFLSVGPGENPGLVVFQPEKKSEPAFVQLYSLTSLPGSLSDPVPAPQAQKTFFKADKIQLKWNANGNSVLFCTATDVDKSNQSYYGEFNLYLLSTIPGSVSNRVALDKEGPIHDFEWSPNSREFVVTYGYMPSKSVLFDCKHNTVFDFGLCPRNFLQFNAQGRLLLIAGFGNLAGQIDIWDRATLKKVACVEGSNTSHCEWSPDGQFFMTATLSPRLRVDNGVKIWHCTGKLIDHKAVEEMYQCSWRPQHVSLFPGFKQLLPTPPNACESVKDIVSIKPAAAAGGAYRPPHARGSETPDIFKREDQGGMPSSPAPSRRNRPPGSTIPGAEASSRSNGKEEKKSRRSKGKKEGEVPMPEVGIINLPAGLPLVATQVEEEQPLPNPNEKKIRSLNKKLKAIDDIRRRLADGETLEKTQILKLETESSIKEELKLLA